MNPDRNHQPKKRLPKAVRLILLALAGIGSLALLIVLLGALTFAVVNRTNGRIISSGETRRYLLHVPKNLDQSQPVPLVITIHGFAQWPANQANVSQWNPIADREGFIVVYPSGTGFPKRWLAFPQESRADSKDVVFISDLIDTLSTQYNIDPSRIYVNGLSNGGGMTFLLGCELAHRMAATGSVGGAFMLPMQECTPSRPVPLIAFHGTADPIVPFHGGPSGGFDLPFPARFNFFVGNQDRRAAAARGDVPDFERGLSDVLKDKFVAQNLVLFDLPEMPGEFGKLHPRLFPGGRSLR